MTDFGLVIFEEIKIKKKAGNSLFKNLVSKLSDKITGLLFNAGFFYSRLGTKLYFSSRKDDLKNGLSCYELLETLKVWIIKLPFTAGILLHLNMNCVIEYLERLCTDKGIREFIIPKPIRDNVPGSSFMSPRPSGKLLLKSLLMPVLEGIYTKAGKRIEHLDIVIVAGSDNEEAFTIVRLLEPYISFVTIVAAEKAELESRLSELFSDSGLSFSISSEYRSRLKHADLVINLGKPADISQSRISKKSLLINLYDSIESSIPGESAVINDVVFDMADINIKNLIYDLHGYFSKSELYEIIITKKLQLDTCDKFTFELAGYIKTEFEKAGCRITGFVGRRGIINADSVVKAIGV
ncbi:MAG: hypothetical protein FIA99_11345 [Ruminiclostridium sp.]|nr:hypothetical protein [Ruminiclostridium sp.]